VIVPDSSDPVARPLALAAILIVSLLLSGCATDNPALGPTQDAQVGVSTTILLLEQVDSGSTVPTVATTTASDMVTILADAERSLAQLPAGSTSGSVGALDAVREATDAVTSAAHALANGEDTAQEQAQLHSAAAALSAAIDGLQ
jgi:hypothetical protein